MKRILLSALMAFLFVGGILAQNIYYSEDFESGQPADWTVEGEWTYGNGTELSSEYFDLTGNATNFMAFNDDGLGANHIGNGRIETSTIDLTAVEGPLFMEIESYFANGDYGGADETFKIYASSNDGETWEEINDFNQVLWGFELMFLDQYAGQSIKLAFEYVDGAAWNFGCAIDNIVISDSPINAIRRSYLMTVNGGSEFSTCDQNIEYPVEGAFLNSGYETVTSFDVTVVNNGVETTQTFDGLNIEEGEGFKYSMDEKVSVGEEDFSVMVFVSNVNGEMEEDEVTGDNSNSIAFAPVETNPNQAVVVEEATGTWCQWCPRGTVYLDEMSKRFKNFVGIAVHNGANDPMVLAEYNSGVTTFPGFSGFPQVIYNRNSVIDPGEIVSPSLTDLTAAPTLTVELGADFDGTTLTSNTRIRFMENAEASDYNVTMVLTEDNLIGEDAAGAQWSQVNNYSGGGFGTMGGFEYFSTNVNSNIWPYSHVGRALIGGFDGISAGSGYYPAGESTIVEQGEFTMNSDWVMENMHIVSIITNSSGEIVNAVSEKLNDAIANGLLSIGTATTEVFDTNLASVFPNPATDFTNVKINVGSASDVTIEVTDMMGQLVSKRNLGTIAGKHNVGYDVSDLSVGTYIFKVIAGERIVTQKVSVIK